jgi:hypothetical protein
MPDNQSRTFVYDPRQTGTDQQTELNRQINDYESLADLGEKGAMSAHRVQIEDALVQFEKSDGGGHPSPQWIVPVMKANALSSFGDLRGAVEQELLGLEAATQPEQKAISHSNMSDHLRRLEEFEASLSHAFRAYELWPECEGVIVNLALSLYNCGQKGAAGMMLETLSKTSSASGPDSLLSVALEFEEDLRLMADLPEVAALLAANEHSHP